MLIINQKPIFFSHLPVFILLFIFPLLTYPQEKKVIAYKELGFQFSIPFEWEGKETDAAYLITSQIEQGFITISTIPKTDILELKQQLNGGINKEKGFFLAPSDQIEIINDDRLQGIFSGLINFSPVIAYIVVLKGEQQQMVMILSANSKENYSIKSELMAIEIAKSFKFFKPQMPSMIDEYKSLLNDSKLTYIESEEKPGPEGRTGYRAKTTIDLCSQGYFNFYNFRSDGIASAFSADNNKEAGQWVIVKNNEGIIVLELRYYDGEINEYYFEYLDGKIYLDGDHYIRTTYDDIKYKPDCN